MTHPATSTPSLRRLAMTESSSAITKLTFIRSLTEYPTMRPEHASLTGHSYSFSSLVACSVMSPNHTRFG